MLISTDFHEMQAVVMINLNKALSLPCACGLGDVNAHTHLWFCFETNTSTGGFSPYRRSSRLALIEDFPMRGCDQPLAKAGGFFLPGGTGADGRIVRGTIYIGKAVTRRAAWLCAARFLKRQAEWSR
jgi:hypothetical protein